MNSIIKEYSTSTVFISAIAYDTSKIMPELRNLLETQFGLEVLFSDFTDVSKSFCFGVRDNFTSNLSNKIDIFLLLVGDDEVETSCEENHLLSSVLEYAESRGIQIISFYNNSVFVKYIELKKTHKLEMVAAQQANIIIDFVENHNEKGNAWGYTFNNPQDIIDTFRKHITHLFSDCLELWKKVHTENSSMNVLTLDGDALFIAISKPRLWEYKLFGKVLESEIYKFRDLRKDFNYGVSFENVKSLTETDETKQWWLSKVKDFLSIGKVIYSLVNEALYTAWGKPGEPGDADLIVYVAERIGAIYQEIIKWGLDLSKTEVDTTWDCAIQELKTICQNALTEIEDFCKKFNTDIFNPELLSNLDNNPINLVVPLNIIEPNVFYHALENLPISNSQDNDDL